MDGCCLHCETYKLSWRTPKKKKNNILSNSKFGFCFFLSKNRDDGTCHKAYCGWDHRTNHFLWKGWSARGGGGPPPPQNLFLSPGLNIAYSIQKPTLPCQFEDLPQKKKKKENRFLSLLSQIVTCSTHSKEKENVDK
jgi:hypothetical protein